MRTAFALMVLCATLMPTCILAFSSSIPSSESPLHSNRVSPKPHIPLMHSDWQLVTDSTPDPNSICSISFILQKQHIAELDELFHQVSDPTHAKYGQYLSAAELRQLTAPTDAIVDQWDTWARALILNSLPTGNSVSLRWNGERDILHVSMSINEMEFILGHEIREYQHTKSGSKWLRISLSSAEFLTADAIHSSPLIPIELRSSLAYTAGLTRFPLHMQAMTNRRPIRRMGRRKQSVPPSASANSAVRRTPSDYADPISSIVLNSPTLTATAPSVHPDALGQYNILHNVQISSDDQSALVDLVVPCTAPVTGNRYWTFPYADEFGNVECSDGSIYSMTAVNVQRRDGSQSTTHTYSAPLLYSYATNQIIAQLRVPLPTNYIDWMLTLQVQWTFTTVEIDYVFGVKGITRIHPLTVRQMYRIPDELTSEVSAATFASHGHMSIAALALGTKEDEQGMFSRKDISTFFESNRIDPWTASSDAKQLLWNAEDGAALNENIPDGETTLDISVTMGINPQAPLSVIHIGANSAATQYEDLFDFAMNDPAINVLSVSYGIDESAVDNYASLNVQLQKLGVRGISVFVASGDSGAFSSGGLCSEFVPSYPASSPYVTSVGGTSLSVDESNDSNTCPHEIVCSIENGAMITSGGGFSALPAQKRPNYQMTAVNQYLNSSNCVKPLSTPFASTGRAYPDVSMLAHNYEIVTNGQTGSVDGTSASSPALAGIIAAFNAIRLQRGLPTLGFLNPLLYQAAASNPNVFNDITSGGNHCQRLGDGWCCADAFNACTGFDPVSGLGSPNFHQLAPFLIPGNLVGDNATVSNYFFPSCANYSSWPTHGSWPSHGSSSHAWVGIVIGVSIGVIILVSICYCVHRRNQLRRSVQHATIVNGYLIQPQSGYIRTQQQQQQQQQRQPPPDHSWQQTQSYQPPQPRPTMAVMPGNNYQGL
jgi:hypothetical protein